MSLNCSVSEGSSYEHNELPLDPPLGREALFQNFVIVYFLKFQLTRFRLSEFNCTHTLVNMKSSNSTVDSTPFSHVPYNGHTLFS